MPDLLGATIPVPGYDSSLSNRNIGVPQDGAQNSQIQNVTDPSREIEYTFTPWRENRSCGGVRDLNSAHPLKNPEPNRQDVDTLLEPDISVICDPSKLDDIGCKGAPDLVMEILSPSTQRHDKLTKFNLYQQAGVREYWIVDPASKSVQVFVLEDGRYAAKDFGAAGDKLNVNIFEDCVIDLSQVFSE